MTEHINLTELLDKALGTLTITANTYACLISRIGIDVINQAEPVIAYTDGKGIYFNQHEFDSLNEQGTIEGKNCRLTKDNLIFIMCHELMHILTESSQRGKALNLVTPEDYRLWNCATDYEINWVLHNNRDSNGRSVPLGKKPEIGLYDEQFANMTAEEIYKKLKTNPNICPKPTSDLNALLGHKLDKHMPIDEMTLNKVKSQAEEVLKQCSNLGDTVSECIMSTLFKPVRFDWKRALSKYFKAFLKGNYTWNKPARSGIATGLRLPSTSTIPMIRVGVALDTSGSISNKMLQKLMQHLFTILSQVKQYEVYTWCVSTEVHKNTLIKYTPSNRNKVKDFKFESTGGTDLSKSFPFIEKEFASKPLDVLIYMTDGYDALNGDTQTKVPYPIVWLIIDNKNFKKPKQIKGAVYSIED